jgi:hypothetical protein
MSRVILGGMHEADRFETRRIHLLIVASGSCESIGESRLALRNERGVRPIVVGRKAVARRMGRQFFRRMCRRRGMADTGSAVAVRLCRKWAESVLTGSSRNYRSPRHSRQKIDRPKHAFVGNPPCRAARALADYTGRAVHEAIYNTAGGVYVQYSED